MPKIAPGPETVVGRIVHIDISGYMVNSAMLVFTIKANPADQGTNIVVRPDRAGTVHEPFLFSAVTALVSDCYFNRATVSVQYLATAGSNDFNNLVVEQPY